MKIILSKPLNYKNENIKELDLVLDNLSGQDLIDVEDDLRRKGININTWNFPSVYLIAVAARALKIPSEALKGLAAKDFLKLTTEVGNFLAVAVSETSTPESSGN